MTDLPFFDYETLDEATHTFVLRKADETRGLLKRTAQNVLAIGQNLQEVKEWLPHGRFLAWLHTEFAMSERQARNFMHAVARFGTKPEIIADLSVTIIYELAAPSMPETVIERVESKRIPPTLEAIRAAKEAERQAREAEQRARAEAQHTQRQLFSLREESEARQTTIAQLTRDIEALQERIASLSTPAVQFKEVVKTIVPPEVTAQVETLHLQVQQLTQQRDLLAKQVTQLGEEARAAALKRDEGDQERHIRLNWYRVTNEFQASIRNILSRWPSPLDTQGFEAQDWSRLAQIKELTRRFLEEFDALTGGSGKVVDGSTISAEELERT
jgi:hypothetical protein